ncbi:mitochondrial sodium/calcium exchanger protein isoform X2 [Patella vulgata]|uniref:mitochondrial sodium/calcium exchanger protein isoform X2 n=1 Tax=Patella vulgata TaxID=6465 RepID=UPI00217FE51F|nr:mitochondrial sodium/calcium exchanger protein isoform X2 [Patella vulgata]
MCPVVFILKLTIPVVDYEDEIKHNWSRYVNSLHCTVGPLFAIFATNLGWKTIGNVYPVWALVLPVGVILSLAVFLTSNNNQYPRYHAVFAYLGFLVSVIWIYCIANEVVNILQMFGIVFNISNAILGLTFLAWGNSIGDLIADTAMAKQGYPRMGISACFGGPLFNLLLGIGIPFTIGTFKNGGSYSLNVTLEEIVLAGFLAFSLVSSLLIVPLSGFRMTRAWGIYLMVLYVVFLLVALLTETGVIHGNL